MELVDIIRWVDKTNDWYSYSEFKNPTDVRDYEEGVGYIYQYKQYTDALTVHLLYLNKDGKIALMRRLFRGCDEFVFMSSLFREEDGIDWLLYEYDVRFGRGSEGLKDALYGDLLTMYVEIIELCREHNINPKDVVPLPHPSWENVFCDIINHTGTRARDNTDHAEQNGLEYFIKKDFADVIGAIDSILKDTPKKKNGDGNGRLIATIVCTLQMMNYITILDKQITRLYVALRAKYGERIGTRQCVTGYINATISGEYKQGYKPIATEELNKYREILLHAINRNKTQ